MHLHLRRVRAHLCARIATQAPAFSRPPAIHFVSACHQIHLPSCRSALLQAFSTEITAAFVAAEDTVAGWPSFSGADVGIAGGVGNLVGRRGRKLFLAVVFAEDMEVTALYRQEKLVVLAHASEKSETLVSEGHQLHDNITYYDASVLLKFVGSGTATQPECMLLAELAPLCSDGNWAGRITACLASEALGCIVKFIYPVDQKARLKQDASAVSRGRGRKGLTLVTTAGARRTCPRYPHGAAPAWDGR